MFSLNRSELRLTLVFAAVLWFMTIFGGDFYLTIIITWAIAFYWNRWHKAHPGESVFEEPEPIKKEEPKSETPKIEEKNSTNSETQSN